MTPEPLTKRKALAFARRGYEVLPLHGILKRRCTCGNAACTSPGKHPHGRFAPNGKDNATADVSTVEAWFDECPYLNYGVSTDRLPTVDIDPRNGGDKSWLALIKKNYDVHTWRVTTGGGGQHIIFGATEVPIPCKTGLVPGVDVKAIGGYIVGVGSQHISGKRYRWAPQCRPKEVELKAPPRWLVDMLGRPKNKPLGSRPPEYYEKLVAPMLEGERNERMTRLLGHLFGSAFPDRVVLLHLVLCFNEVNVHPPLNREEIYKIARSLAGREKRKSGAA